MRCLFMHKNVAVLQMELDESTGTISGVGEIFAPEHLPAGVAANKGVPERASLNGWWTTRAIPASRSGLRDALAIMGIPSPQLLLTKCYGLSLSDQYWICPENSGMQWKDVNFFDNPFSEDVGNILFGSVPENAAFSLLSPDNTSDGWLRKKWKIIDNKRCLIKGGSGATQQEPYNEVLASAIMRRLGIPHIPYMLMIQDEYPYSVCEDFITQETELISAWHITQTQKRQNHVSPYQHYLNCCDTLGIPGVGGSLDRMLTVDYLIANEDRHYNNFGAVRNADTLEWIGAAPIFDCGTSMWLLQPPSMIRPAAKLPSKPFKPDHEEQIKLVSSFEWLDLSALIGIDEEFRELLRGSAFIDGARRDALCNGLLRRVEMLEAHIHGRQAPESPPQKWNKSRER